MAAGESLAKVTKRRLLGVLFLVLVTGFVTLSILIYNKAFTTTVDVTLKADHTGNQLLPDSDVTERGVVVGSVKSVSADGSNASIKLALDPGQVKNVPDNVRAQILPKTLFGEQYVALSAPGGDDTAPPITGGATIPQDRSKGALEAQDVLGDLLPVLQAVKPQDLNATLNAIATALQGRGKELGRTLVAADRYIKGINPHTDQLIADLKKLGQVSLEYNGVAPDIFATLKNLETSVETVVQKRTQLDRLLTVGASTAQVLDDFITTNRQNAIAVVGQTDQIYQLLQRYSPEFVCLFQGLSKLTDSAGQIVYDRQLHLSGQVELPSPARGDYQSGNQPNLVTGYGPSCFGLPDDPQPLVNGNFQIPSPLRCINDGYPLTGAACAKTRRATPSSADDELLGSPAENSLVNALIASSIHTTPDKVPGGLTILAAPMLRGQRVVVK